MGDVPLFKVEQVMGEVYVVLVHLFAYEEVAFDFRQRAGGLNFMGDVPAIQSDFAFRGRFVDLEFCVFGEYFLLAFVGDVIVIDKFLSFVVDNH